MVNKKYRRIFIAGIVLWLLGLFFWYLQGKNFAVLNPAGIVAFEQRKLLIVTLLLGLLVVVPVFILTFVIAWRYREGNTKAKYSPELSGNFFAESIWWGVPTIIIVVLSVITWNSSYALDPKKPLSSKDPLVVQVIALEWKWLFIYPKQGVASINQIQLPINTPVRFQITADAPMNSFWIPQLGGQIYAMTGMTRQLNLMADKAGSYNGSSANLSGKGFAGMRFTADVGSDTDFKSWVLKAKRAETMLNTQSYQQLAKPSSDHPATLYSAVEPNLFDDVLKKYMAPAGDQHAR